MEMILVLAIIAILIGGGVVLMRNVNTDAEIVRARSDLGAIQMAITRYKTMTRSLPASLEDLVKKPAHAQGSWYALLKESALIDPWKQPYVLKNPGKRGTDGYEVYSKGLDMQDGTADDIGNW